MTDKIKFDPGIGELVVNFNEFINEVYSQLMAFRTIHQKRARFKLYASKIERYINNNISFYAGCLLWGVYIFNLDKENPKEIEGNPFYNMTQEEKENYDYMLQVNFLDNYFDNYERDMLYYTGKRYIIPEKWKNILDMYSKFLEINQGFSNLKYTSDLKLPEELIKQNFSFDIEKLIKKAIDEKNLELLSDVAQFA